MAKEAALKKFFSGFGITAYPSTAVPENVEFPYLTYEVITSAFEAEENMVVDYGQQCALKTQVNAVVIQALGGINTPAYSDKNVRSRTYNECNRDIQNWFRVNSRNNIPRKRFDDAVDYIQRWRPSMNMSMLIRQTNEQVQIYK